MTWQDALVLTLAAAALGFVVWGRRRRRPPARRGPDVPASNLVRHKRRRDTRG